MEYAEALIKYIGDNPLAGVAAIIVLVGIYALLNRKPKIVRDADQRFETLRRGRGDYYNNQRPLK